MIILSRKATIGEIFICGGLVSIRRKKGFTLIELVTYIVLMGILALALVPLFGIGTVPFKSAVDKLKHDIRHAQWEAMSRKIRHGIIFNPASETYHVYQGNPTNIIADPLNPTNQFIVNYTTDNKFTDVLIDSVNINGTNRVEFDGRGFPYDANNNILTTQGTVVLSRQGTQVTITIEPNTGRVAD